MSIGSIPHLASDSNLCEQLPLNDDRSSILEEIIIKSLACQGKVFRSKHAGGSFGARSSRRKTQTPLELCHVGSLRFQLEKPPVRIDTKPQQSATQA
jgi:hypothetical protein